MDNAADQVATATDTPPETPAEQPAKPVKHASAKTPTPTPKAADPVETPKPPEGVQITPEQMERFRQNEITLKALQDAEEARSEEARKADEKRLLEEGKLKELVAKKDEEIVKRDTKLRETEATFKATLRAGQLASELAKHALRDEFAAAQLAKLWSDELEVVADSGIYRVQSRDGKPIERYVADALKSKEYSSYVAATNRGGAGAQGTDRRAPEPPPLDPADHMANQLRGAYKARHENVPVALAGRNRLAGSRDNVTSN